MEGVEFYRREQNQRDFSWVHHHMNSRGVHPRFTSHVFDESTRGTRAGKLLEAYRLGDEFGFFLHGGAGCGKTYLLHCLGNSILEQAKSCKELLSKKWGTEGVRNFLLFETSSGLARQSRELKTRGELFEKYTRSNFLFLDDLGTEYASDWVLEFLYELIDSRCRNLRPTFFSSNNSLDTLGEKLGARVQSRILEMCVPVEVQGEDRRKNILRLNFEKLSRRLNGREEDVGCMS